MSSKKIVLYFFCLMFFECNSNKNPYANNSGIEPSLLAEMDTAHYTLIEWKDSVNNFGTINSADSVKLKYEFKNIGETPLFILNTRTTCGCTVTNFPKEPVMPGKSGTVSVIFKSGNQTGEINKTIVVIANTKNSKSSNLILRGVVKPGKQNQ